MSRGMLLNNPFDIEISTIPWQGKVTPSADPVFEQFDTMEHGVRAGFKDLLYGFNVHGRKTIAALVTPYAPPSENNTEAYIAAMCKHTGYGENDAIDLTDLDTLICVGEGFIIEEQGNVIDQIGQELIDEAAIDALQNTVAKPKV